MNLAIRLKRPVWIAAEAADAGTGAGSAGIFALPGFTGGVTKSSSLAVSRPGESRGTSPAIPEGFHTGPGAGGRWALLLLLESGLGLVKETRALGASSVCNPDRAIFIRNFAVREPHHPEQGTVAADAIPEILLKVAFPRAFATDWLEQMKHLLGC